MLNAIALFVPTVLILIGILFNRADNNMLRTEFNGLRGEFNDLRSQFGDLRGEMSGLQGNVTRQIGDLKDANHKDALEIMRQMTALHER